MKSIKKMFILSLLAFSLVATGCDLMGQIFDKPEETERDYTDSTGAQVHEEVTETKKEKVTEKKVTETDGTVIESTKTENYENDTTTYVEDTTAKDYTKHLESEAVMEPDETGIEKMTTTTESTQTFTDDSEGDIKEIKEHKVEKDGSNETGAVTDQTTTTTKKDGSVIEEKSYSEGRSGYKKTSKDVVDKDGKKVESESTEHKEIPSEKQDFDEDGIKVSSTEENVKITYDDQGKEATKVVTETTNPGIDGFFNKQVQTEYKIVNGEPVETKRTEHLKLGRDEKRVTEPQTDGTKKITITVNDLDDPNISLGTGSGTTDTNGVTTITINYTNGIDLTTVEDKDTVTKEILLTDYGTKKYYEKTVTEKDVLTSKECEYLYDDGAGIVFKTVTTYSSGTETRKSGRYIENEGLSPASYDSKYTNIPGNDGIYDRTTDIEIYADGQNAEEYTTFTTKAWNGPKGDYDIIDYPYDSSVDMSKLHLL